MNFLISSGICSTPNNIKKNGPFHFFASILIASLTPFINKPDSSRNLTILITSFIASLEIINTKRETKFEGRVPDPNIFYE